MGEIAVFVVFVEVGKNILKFGFVVGGRILVCGNVEVTGDVEMHHVEVELNGVSDGQKVNVFEFFQRNAVNELSRLEADLQAVNAEIYAEDGFFAVFKRNLNAEFQSIEERNTVLSAPINGNFRADFRKTDVFNSVLAVFVGVVNRGIRSQRFHQSRGCRVKLSARRAAFYCSCKIAEKRAGDAGGNFNLDAFVAESKTEDHVGQIHLTQNVGNAAGRVTLRISVSGASFCCHCAAGSRIRLLFVRFFIDKTGQKLDQIEIDIEFFNAEKRNVCVQRARRIVNADKGFAGLTPGNGEKKFGFVVLRSVSEVEVGLQVQNEARIDVFFDVQPYQKVAQKSARNGGKVDFAFAHFEADFQSEGQIELHVGQNVFVAVRIRRSEIQRLEPYQNMAEAKTEVEIEFFFLHSQIDVYIKFAEIKAVKAYFKAAAFGDFKARKERF